jgi:SAM-dependent methyltransferase
MAFSPTYYDSIPGVLCLLIEHYGLPDQIFPMHREALRLCGTKASAVDEAMRQIHLPHRRRALDLGCAVGGGVFRLRHYFDQAVGVDRSSVQLAQARTLQRTRETSVTWTENGVVPRTYLVRLPDDVVTEGIEFIEADIYALPANLGVFDLVTIEKVLECLPDPQRFMAQIPSLVAPGGYFMHVSSYRWSSEFTPPEKQLGTPAQAPAQLDKLLGPHFTRECRFNVPFLLESDSTSFCYGVAETLLWKRH